MAPLELPAKPGGVRQLKLTARPGGDQSHRPRSRPRRDFPYPEIEAADTGPDPGGVLMLLWRSRPTWAPAIFCSPPVDQIPLSPGPGRLFTRAWQPERLSVQASNQSPTSITAAVQPPRSPGAVPLAHLCKLKPSPASGGDHAAPPCLPAPRGPSERTQPAWRQRPPHACRKLTHRGACRLLTLPLWDQSRADPLW